MGSQHSLSVPHVIVDSIHGDIHLSDLEMKVIDTASFQRLRYLKQLGMGHVTYPNATHTRFAHSIGVLGIMARVTDLARDTLELSSEDVQDLRLAGLLHDIGHYPYSHLMEHIDNIKLTEEFIESSESNKTLIASSQKYFDHEIVGEAIVTSQEDLVGAIGGEERATKIAKLFRREESAHSQLSKLIHSSLDMDRLDYLLRDAQAAGVPYGKIDLNYLLNNFHVSNKGVLGVKLKALTAVEQFLYARFFMHKAVYYHKTTFALEEICRQLLRRLKDNKFEGLPRDGNEVIELVKSKELNLFNDSFVDRIIEKAVQGEDDLIKSLASCLRERKPPKLLKEVSVYEQIGTEYHAGSAFKKDCRNRIQSLAENNEVDVRRIIFCETKQLKLEQRAGMLSEKEARSLEDSEREEIVKVFKSEAEEPVSIMNIDHSILNVSSNYFYQSFRLYYVPNFNESNTNELVNNMKEEVSGWE